MGIFKNVSSTTHKIKDGKAEKNSEFCHLQSVTKIIGIGHVFSWCSNPMHKDTSCGTFSVMIIILFYLKKIWKIKILPHLPRYLSCLFGLRKVLILNYSDVMGNCLPSKWLKTTNCKILHLNFLDFLQQSVTKIMGKTAVWAVSCLYPLPLPNNVEKQRAKLASSCYGFAALYREEENF